MRQAVRAAALSASMLLALVVAALPGTTSASSTPVRSAASPAMAATPEPLMVPVSFADLLAPPDDAVAALHEVSVDAAQQPPAVAPEVRPAPPSGPPAEPEAAPRTSVLGDALVISVYGHPGVCVMGELGCHDDPAGAVEAARALVAEYEPLTDLPVLPALHLIVDVAQPSPGDGGRYLWQMESPAIRAWVDLARDEGVLLFLDIQIGWSEVLTDVQRLGEFLSEPHVHLAIDPEFATKSDGMAPGASIGELLAAEVNAVQDYLAELVQRSAIPPKVLVLHQFREDMLPDAEDFRDVPEVDLTVDMDGWGSPWPKQVNYEHYAMAPYSEYPTIKLFFHWDEPLMTPAEVMALAEPPAYVIYQ